MIANVRCSSPTCAATLHIIGADTAPAVLLAAALRRLGWALEQQPGDDRSRPYCPRCTL